MRLYELPQGAKIKVETNRAPKGEMCTFHHIDGAYSYCTADEDEAPFHLSAWTPLKKVGKHYEIKALKK